MANKEHFELIKQGVDAWYSWRREHDDISPDLCEANLCGADAVNRYNKMTLELRFYSLHTTSHQEKAYRMYSCGPSATTMSSSFSLFDRLCCFAIIPKLIDAEVVS
jgi:hypothetical protein